MLLKTMLPSETVQLPLLCQQLLQLARIWCFMMFSFIPTVRQDFKLAMWPWLFSVHMQLCFLNTHTVIGEVTKQHTLTVSFATGEMHYSPKKMKERVALAVCVYPERCDVSNWSDREKFTWMMDVIWRVLGFYYCVVLKKKNLSRLVKISRLHQYVL